MNTISIILLVATIILTTIGQLLIKKGATSLDGNRGLIRTILKSPWLMGGLFCALIAPLFYMMALREIPLSVAFPSMASTYVLVAAGAAYFFNEKMNFLAWSGVFFIVLGLFFIRY